MSRAPRIVLWAAALGFAGFGVVFAVAPRAMAAYVDIVLPTDTALTDFVATYGGFQIGVSVFLFLCLRRDEWVRTGLMASGCAVAGFAIARGVGILVLPAVKPVLTRVLVFEASSAAIAFWAAGRTRS